MSQQKLEDHGDSDEDIKQYKVDQAGTGGKFALPADNTGEDNSHVVPLVKHPEFVYGGQWARTKTAATLIEEEAKTDACHATTILHLDDGEVLMAWFGGTYEGAEDVGIWIARRDNAGWDTPHLAAKVATFFPSLCLDSMVVADIIVGIGKLSIFTAARLGAQEVQLFPLRQCGVLLSG